MYTKIGEISEECRQYLIEVLPETAPAKNQKADLGSYGASPQVDLNTLRHPELIDQLEDFERWDWAWVVNVPAKGLLHEHKDSEPDRFKPRYHIVLKTNDKCESWNGGKPYHLDDRGIYEMEPGLPHKSLNEGDSDRLHLVLLLKRA